MDSPTTNKIAQNFVGLFKFCKQHIPCLYTIHVIWKADGFGWDLKSEKALQQVQGLLYQLDHII